MNKQQEARQNKRIAHIARKVGWDDELNIDPLTYLEDYCKGENRFWLFYLIGFICGGAFAYFIVAITAS